MTWSSFPAVASGSSRDTNRASHSLVLWVPIAFAMFIAALDPVLGVLGAVRLLLQDTPHHRADSCVPGVVCAPGSQVQCWTTSTVEAFIVLCFAGISSSRSDLLLPSFLPAHQQRSHPWREEGVCLPLAGLHTRAEALQGSVHVGGTHAKAHRREATQVHGELAGIWCISAWQVDLGLWWSQKCVSRHRHGCKQGSPKVPAGTLFRASAAVCVWVIATCRLHPGDRASGQGGWSRC